MGKTFKKWFWFLAEKGRRICPDSLKFWVSRAAQFLNAEQKELEILPSESRFPDLESTLKYLRGWGCRPRRAIDVGAYVGSWTYLFRHIFPESRVLMVEPQHHLAPYLSGIVERSQGMVGHVEALLGSQDDRDVQFVEMETGSSVFEEESPYTRSYVSRKLQTLDRLAGNQPDFFPPDFLKLDVQGYELEVLKGFSKGISSVEFILMEASLVPINRGCPTIAEVIRFMDEQGFCLFDFCSMIRRKDHALWQTDLLFIHRSSRFLPNARLTHQNWS